jgi:hypothetical protein
MTRDQHAGEAGRRDDSLPGQDRGLLTTTWRKSPYRLHMFYIVSAYRRVPCWITRATARRHGRHDSAAGDGCFSFETIPYKRRPPLNQRVRMTSAERTIKVFRTGALHWPVGDSVEVESPAEKRPASEHRRRRTPGGSPPRPAPTPSRAAGGAGRHPHARSRAGAAWPDDGLTVHLLPGRDRNHGGGPGGHVSGRAKGPAMRVVTKAPLRS